MDAFSPLKRTDRGVSSRVLDYRIEDRGLEKFRRSFPFSMAGVPCGGNGRRRDLGSYELEARLRSCRGLAMQDDLDVHSSQNMEGGRKFRRRKTGVRLRFSNAGKGAHPPSLSDGV